jgi:bile acid:Na+ symporter, BASS family
MELVTTAFNVSLVVFIVTTMLAAGLATRLTDLAAVLRQGTLLTLVLLANLVVVPLLGWGVAAAFGLSAAATVALILVASSPGAPFGAKVAMMQRGDVLIGSTVQVLLAALGSLTFPVTANLLLGWAGLGDDLSLPVGDLVRSVAILQLIPFGVGLAVRHGNPSTAADWGATAQRASSVSFAAVLALGLGSSWEGLVTLFGSRTLVAAATFTVLSAAAGAVLARGPAVRRTTLAGIAPLRNAGPSFAAVAIAFDSDPEILAALTGILVVGLVLCVPAAARLASTRPEPPPAIAEPPVGPPPSAAATDVGEADPVA